MPTPFCCNGRMESSTAGWYCPGCGLVLNCDLVIIQQPVQQPSSAADKRMVTSRTSSKHTPDPMTGMPAWPPVPIRAGSPWPPEPWPPGTWAGESGGR